MADTKRRLSASDAQDIKEIVMDAGRRSALSPIELAQSLIDALEVIERATASDPLQSTEKTA